MDFNSGKGGSFKAGSASWTRKVGTGESSGSQSRQYRVGQVDSSGDTVMGGVNATKASNNLRNQIGRSK